jgi:hypothetical protein
LGLAQFRRAVVFPVFPASVVFSGQFSSFCPLSVLFFSVRILKNLDFKVFVLENYSDFKNV